MPTPSLYRALGTTALNSRMRALSERIAVDNQALEDAYGVPLRTHWYAPFTAIARAGAAGTTAAAIAEAVGLSHVAIGKTVRELMRAGLVAARRDPADGRRTVLTLTPAGQAAREQLAPLCADVTVAVDEVLAEAQHNLWTALGEFEDALDRRGLYARTLRQRRAREAEHLMVVPYADHHAAAFRALNIAWIERYFAVEPEDLRLLDDPRGTLLDTGGYIAMALWRGEPVGTCGLLALPDDPDYDFELVKMAVSPRAQGLGLGEALGRHVLAEAVRRGARAVYLETNAKLQPALALYRKLGFVEVEGHASPFARCGVQMGWRA